MTAVGPATVVLFAEIDGNPDDPAVAVMVAESEADVASEVDVDVEDTETGSTTTELVAVVLALLLGMADVPVLPPVTGAGGAPPSHFPLHAAVYPGAGTSIPVTAKMYWHWPNP